MTQFRAVLLALALLIAPAVAAQEAPTIQGLVIKPSDYSVAETIDRLETALREKGLTIFARIDHAENAASADMDLRPTQILIFGNPRLGTPLMQAAQTAGIDLPQKMLAWEDAQGHVWLGYSAPRWLGDRHAILGQQQVLQQITQALDNFSDAATR